MKIIICRNIILFQPKNYQTFKICCLYVFHFIFVCNYLNHIFKCGKISECSRYVNLKIYNKIIFWWCLNRYYLMILIRCYYLVSIDYLFPSSFGPSRRKVSCCQCEKFFWIQKIFFENWKMSNRRFSNKLVSAGISGTKSNHWGD